MPRLPSTIASSYRPATDHEIRSQSFGQLDAIRNPAASTWEQRRGTLDDQRIFGTRRNLECACGEYRGPRYQNIICHVCGVKITSPDVRRQRFGHIELRVSITHPFGETGECLSVVPVLPASFFESKRGRGLAEVYEDLLRSAAAECLEEIQIGWNRLNELLLPALTFAHEWNLALAVTIARGLALELPPIPSDVYCDRCGYPLEGLVTLICPGCGKRLSS
jgi:Zn finger protein HypA/HybF involved in hydrogenase expression